MTFIAKAPKIDVRRLRKKKSYEAEEVLRRLNAFLDKNFEEPMKILRHFWQDQQDAMTYAELREAIKAGHLTDETARAWRHDYAKLVNDQFSHTWRNALALGPSGQPSMDNLTSFRLDMQKPGVLNWIGSRAADFVTNEVQEQKDAIRSVLMRGVTNQHTVDEMARVIRPLVGLNKPQTIANYNYYNHMVKTLTEQHPRTSAASIQARAQEASVKYAEKQHRARAMMIARTELSFAYNRGAYEGIKQAQDLGLMGAVVKIWSTSQGGNVCPECEALEGEEVGMDAPFFDSRGLFKGDNLVPPLHPRCYCAIVYQEVEKAKNSLLGDGIPDNFDFYNVPEDYGDFGNPFLSNNNYANRFFSGADFKTGGIDFKTYIENKTAENFKNLANQKATLQDMIKDGVLSDKIREQKQREHVEGTKERIRRLNRDKTLNGTPSSVFKKGIEPVDLLSANKHDEIIVFDKKNHRVKHFFSVDKKVGCVYNVGERKYVETGRVVVEYSKKGLHMYPVKDW